MTQVTLIPEDVVLEWLSSCASHSLETARTYRCGLRALECYVLREGLDIDSLTKQDLERFRDDVAKTHSASTVATYLNAIRSFYRWAENDAFEDIAFKVKGAHTQKGFKKDSLSLEQAKHLLNSIERDDARGARDFAIINTMIRTGLRDIEVVRANIEDIASKDGASILSIQGKGRDAKDDFVVLTAKALDPIYDYLENFRQGATPSCPLFTSVSNRNYGCRLTKQSLSRLIKGRLVDAGLNSPRLTAHSLRHTAVTFSLLGGASVDEAQHMARHASISTTMIYAHNLERLNNAAESKIDNLF